MKFSYAKKGLNALFWAEKVKKADKNLLEIFYLFLFKTQEIRYIQLLCQLIEHLLVGNLIADT